MYDDTAKLKLNPELTVTVRCDFRVGQIGRFENASQNLLDQSPLIEPLHRDIFEQGNGGNEAILWDKTERI